MLAVSRKCSFVLLTTVALVATGCGSNNAGKIEGKWQATSLPGLGEKEAAAFKMLGEGNVKLVMEFAGGKMTMTVNINMLGQSKTQQVASADYSLGSGDTVNFTNLKPPAKNGATKSRDKITINGDTMTIAMESGENVTLTRMK